MKSEDKSKTSEHVTPTITVIDQREQADITAADIERRQPENLKKLLEYDPSVNFVNMSRSGQLADIEIRGMGGMDGANSYTFRGRTGSTASGAATTGNMGNGANRVTMEVDGMDIAQSLSFGHNKTYGRNYVDPADLKSVRIQKGPGSEGLAGAVQMRTKDPEDYLQPGQTFGGDVRLGAHSDDDSKNVGFTLAGKLGEQTSAMLAYTRRSYHEVNNEGGIKTTGSARTAADPQDGSSNSVNAKLVHQAGEHRLTLGVQHFDSKSDVDGLSSMASSLNNTSTVRTDSHPFTRYESSRNAAFVRHEWQAGNALFDTATTQLSIQRSTNKNRTTTHSTATTLASGAATSGTAVSGSEFVFKNYSLRTEFEKTLGQHALQYGLRVQYSSADVDGSTPQDEPLATLKQWNIRANVADRIELTPDLHLTPSLDINHVRITPETETGVASLSGKYSKTGVGGGVRLDWRFMQGQLATVSLVRSMRMPALGEIGVQNYGHWWVRPNMNLKPERGNALELAWSSRGELGRQKTTVFINRYQDLISVECGDWSRSYTDPNANPCDIMNDPGRTTIRGLEWSGALNLDQLLGQGVKGLSLNAAIAWSKGRTKGQPRARIEPLRGHMGVAYEHPSTQWGVEARVNFSAAKKAKDLPTPTNGVPAPLAGWGTVDLTAHIEPMKNLTVQAGLYNLFDRQYAVWSRVRGIPVTSTSGAASTRASYTEPGRNFGINLRYQF